MAQQFRRSSVSYTHLDVYKRQLQSNALFAALTDHHTGLCAVDVDGHAGSGSGRIHSALDLDVYKRQEHNMEARAILRYARISPRKVSIVMDLIRTKPLDDCLLYTSRCV